MPIFNIIKLTILQNPLGRQVPPSSHKELEYLLFSVYRIGGIASHCTAYQELPPRIGFLRVDVHVQASRNMLL